MKKTFFTLLLLAATTLLSAQSLQIENEGQVYENGETVICPFNEMYYEYFLDLGIRNNTDQEKVVVVEQDVVNTYENVMISFCWGQCLVPLTNPTVSPEVVIPANTLSTEEFAIHINIPDTETGVVKIIYNVYDVNNPDEKVSITVLAGSNADVAESNVNLGHAYPNPASSTVHFDYSFDGNSTVNAVVYNLLGQEVRVQPLLGNQGRINIDVTDFQPGIYFCSIQVDNATVSTEKFIVRH